MAGKRTQGQGPELVGVELGLATCGDAGGVNVDGAACAAFRRLSEESGLCVWHDPSREEERDALHHSRMEGARAATEARAVKRPERMPSFPPDTLDRLAKWHQWAVSAVAVGEINTRVGDSIARNLQQLRPVLLNLGLEGRVRELEVELRKAKKKAASVGVRR